MKVGQRAGDLTSGLVCLLVGAWYLAIAFRDLKFWTPGNQPGGGFFPVLLGSGLVLLSCSLILRGWRAQVRPDDRTIIDRESVAKPAVVLGSVAVWIYLFPILGYVLSTWILTSWLVWVFGPAASPRKRVLAAIGLSGLGVVGFYTIFGVIFSLELPTWPSLG